MGDRPIADGRLAAAGSSRVHPCWIVVVSLALSAAACGPRASGPAPSSDGDATSGSTAAEGTMSATSTSAGASEETGPPFEPIACGPNSKTSVCEHDQTGEHWFICQEGWGCSNLLCSPSHCGECGHACPVGSCWDGLCGSGASPCITPEESVRTCAEVCAQIGLECEDRLQAESGHKGCDRGYAYSLADPWTGEPRCGSVFGPNNTVDAACTDEIGWNHGTDEQPQTGVSCCCRGET